jgi:hypothetical protein
VVGGQELLFHTLVDAPAVGASASQKAPREAFSPVTTVGQSVSSSSDLPGAFEKIARVASQAMARGRADEAERTLERALAEVLSLSRCRIDVGPSLTASAARHAAYLAAATRKGAWIDYVFDLYTVRREPIPIPISDVLSGAAESITPDDLATVKAYLAMSGKLAKDSPSAARSHACVMALAKRYGAL